MPTRTRTHPSRRSASVDDDPSLDPDPSRLPLTLSVVALVVAIAGLGWSLFSPGGGDACQAQGWDAIPTEAELPSGWWVGTSNFFVGNLTMTLAGPESDVETGDGTIFATVTCYSGDGAEALARSRVADQQAGSQTADMTDIGDGGYSIGDGGTGLSAIHFRRNALVAYLVVNGVVAADDLRDTAKAIDRAIMDARAGTIPTVGPIHTLVPGSFEPVESGEPSGDPLASSSPGISVAPELEAMLPTELGDTPFTVSSTSGAEVLSDDPGSRAMTAALRELDKTPADLQLAQGYDPAETLDVYFVAFRLPGADVADLRTLIIQSWLVADAEGVTIEDVTLGGKAMTHVDYGDELADAYVYVHEDAVILIHTSSTDLATTAAEALP